MNASSLQLPADGIDRPSIPHAHHSRLATTLLAYVPHLAAATSIMMLNDAAFVALEPHMKANPCCPSAPACLAFFLPAPWPPPRVWHQLAVSGAV
jgi:hypothetical protein